jgi:hypothetical protein
MVEVLIEEMVGSDWKIRPTDYERAVVVDADGETKRTRPLTGVNGEVCKKKRKKLWKERKKDLTEPVLLEMGARGVLRLVNTRLLARV